MSIRLPLITAVMVSLWAASPPPASAHPHVWIDARLSVAFAPGDRVQALTVTWRLDELYSQTAVSGLDDNANGVYDESELKPLVADAMLHLKEWFYFTDIRVGEERVKTAKVADYRAFMDGDRLVYEFTLPLAKPVKPDGLMGLRARLFVGIDLEKTDPVILAGASKACTQAILPAPGFEETMLLSENAFANEVEPGTEGPGGRFAETVTITCD
jgi:ABC-type uncharacterized transport system substrate-binding protein